MNPLNSFKKHRVLSSRRSEERADGDKLFKKRSTSVETRIRVPKATVMVNDNIHPNTGSDEPLIEDFYTHYIQPMSRNNAASNPILVSPEDHLRASPSFSQGNAYDDDEAPVPPSFSRARAVPNQLNHTSQQTKQPLDIDPPRRLRDSGSYSGSNSLPTTLDSRERVSIDSSFSQDTTATSINTLPALQVHGFLDESDRLQPVLEDDPSNFDLVAAPPEEVTGVYQLEKQAEQLFSREHLECIFADRKSLLRFTGFLNSYRPQSIPILIFFFDALKALRAIKYANAVAEALSPIPGFGFTECSPQPTQNEELQAKVDQAFDVLVREDLPAYIAHTWIQIASTSIKRRVTGTLAPHLREASEGLAEVFCLSDPSRKDNPIVFASEEFHRTTQYGMSYSIGRNCRFLQGPRTSPHSVRRLAEACKAPREHSEVFVNYRRDGSPFVNLLMVAPLFDSKGTLRYFIGAQVDVSGLLKEATGFETMSKLVERSEAQNKAGAEDKGYRKDEFRNLSEMFNTNELDSVRQFGGRMHSEQFDDDDRESLVSHRPRLLLKDPSSELLDRSGPSIKISGARIPQNGKLEGVYQNYLLVRPAPSLRILFTSPTLRVPGILQSPFLSRIGGSSRVRSDLAQALTEGRGVTAKIRWLTRLDEDGEGEDEGRSRWIHCTPLLGHKGEVGVWMVVLVDEEGSGVGQGKRRFRPAPPVSQVIGGKEYDACAMRDTEEAIEGYGAKAQRSRPSSGWSARGSVVANASDYSFHLR